MKNFTELVDIKVIQTTSSIHVRCFLDVHVSQIHPLSTATITPTPFQIWEKETGLNSFLQLCLFVWGSSKVQKNKSPKVEKSTALDSVILASTTSILFSSYIHLFGYSPIPYFSSLWTGRDFTPLILELKPKDQVHSTNSLKTMLIQ